MPSKDELYDMIRDLQEKIRQLENGRSPLENTQRHIRVAKKDGNQSTASVQPIKFLNGDKSERGPQYEVAAKLEQGEVAVFEQDGLWHELCGCESGECNCCELLEIMEAIADRAAVLDSNFNDVLTIGERIGQVQERYECKSASPCSACQGGEAPSPIAVTLSGVFLNASSIQNWFFNDDDRDRALRTAFSNWANSTHQISLGKFTRYIPLPGGVDPMSQGNGYFPNVIPARGGAHGCWGNDVTVLDSWSPGDGSGFTWSGQVAASVNLIRQGGDDGADGHWGVYIDCSVIDLDAGLPTWGTFGGVTALLIFPNMPSGTGPLWTPDCGIKQFADSSDITWEQRQVGTVSTFYSPGGHQWSVEIDGSQASTPPPPPPV